MTSPHDRSRTGWRAWPIIGWFGQRRAVTLAMLALLGLSLMGFIQVAEEVLEGEWRGFDETVLLALRAPGAPDDPLGPPWFEELVRDLTALGGLGVVSLLTLGVCGYLLSVRRRGTALYILVAIAGGAVVSSVLKQGFDRPRPDLVAHGMNAYQSSFPSGHSMMSTVVYLTLGVLLARLPARRPQQVYIMSLAVIVVLLVGCSRVYLGVHWPTDVIAGWAAGAAWAASCWLGALWLAERESDVPGSAVARRSRQADRNPHPLLAAVCILLGLVPVAIACGVVTVDPTALRTPPWVLALCGLVFVLGGCMMLLGRDTRANDLLAGSIGLALSAVGLWVAVAGPSRGFSGGIPLLAQDQNVTLGRWVIGGGAIASLGLALLALRRARRSRG